MDEWSKAPFPVHDIHFLAGVRGAQHKKHFVAKCRCLPKGYKLIEPQKILPRLAAQKVLLRVFKNDVAIVLNKQGAIDPVRVAEGVLRQLRLRLVHAAYLADWCLCSQPTPTVTFSTPT